MSARRPLAAAILLATALARPGLAADRPGLAADRPGLAADRPAALSVSATVLPPGAPRPSPPEPAGAPGRAQAPRPPPPGSLQLLGIDGPRASPQPR